ncbi:glycosyltransferase [Methylobacterium nigriterrae]|uniref:glycosyltransferase n=1 Tax=Methylobacterium nigriterrae TaxID=3127512 RepID=UPI003013B8B6
MMDLRVAVLAHSHPALTKGGGEVVAHRSFLHLREVCGHASLFAAAPAAVAGASSIFARDERIVEYDRDEFLLNAQHYDTFLGSTGDWQLLEEVAAVCEAQKINVFHFHHFFRLGMNAAAYLQTRFPDAVFVLTLHEYLSICYQHGQMVKRNTRLLCDRSSPIDCHLCFPEHTKEEFRLRRNFFAQAFKNFHAVTSPSRFLADRVEAAGLAEPIQLVRNGTSGLPVPAAGQSPPDLHLKFAFFGQNTPFKGLDVYLKAAISVLERLGPVATFSVFGCDALSACQMPDCQDLAPALAKWPGCIQFRGIYDPRAVVDHMRSCGWIVVPSIWWENSPIVIQEAFLAERPVLCSGIGGMSEAVSHEGNGLHVRPNDPADLASTFERCLADREVWSRLQSGITPPQTIEQMNGEFMRIYQDVRRRLTVD